jgi:hypothetical protein
VISGGGSGHTRGTPGHECGCIGRSGPNEPASAMAPR